MTGLAGVTVAVKPPWAGRCQAFISGGMHPDAESPAYGRSASRGMAHSSKPWTASFAWK